VQLPGTRIKIPFEDFQTRAPDLPSSHRPFMPAQGRVSSAKSALNFNIAVLVIANHGAA
jgi:hypothetical protein